MLIDDGHLYKVYLSLLYSDDVALMKSSSLGNSNMVNIIASLETPNNRYCVVLYIDNYLVGVKY